MRINTTKQKLQQGKVVFGAIISENAPGLVEYCGAIGFDFVGSDSAYAILRQVSALLASIKADSLEKGGGEADIGPLMEKGVPGMGLRTDPTRYFWYHHTNGDTMDKPDPAEMARCVATMAVMAYVVADLPDPLPRGAPAK